METEDKVLIGLCFLAMVAIFTFIGGCSYNERQSANEKFKLNMQQNELLRDGKPTKLEVVVHKLDDEQFKELIQAIKEKP